MTTITWRDGISGDWAAGGNWVGGVVPTAADDVVIAGTGVETISLAGSQQVHDLTISDAGAGLALADGASLTVLGTLSEADAGAVSIGGGASLTLSQDETSLDHLDLRLGSMVAGSALTGTLTANTSQHTSPKLTLGSDLTLTAVGDAYIRSGVSPSGSSIVTYADIDTDGHTVELHAAVIENRGTIHGSGSLILSDLSYGANAPFLQSVSNYGDIDVGHLRLRSDPTLQITNYGTMTGEIEMVGPVANHGTITFVGGEVFTPFGQVDNEGVINIAAGEIPLGDNTSGNVLGINNGTINVEAGATLLVASQGTYQFGDALAGTGTIHLHGAELRFEPRASGDLRFPVVTLTDDIYLGGSSSLSIGGIAVYRGTLHDLGPGDSIHVAGRVSNVIVKPSELDLEYASLPPGETSSVVLKTDGPLPAGTVVSLQPDSGGTNIVFGAVVAPPAPTELGDQLVVNGYLSAAHNGQGRITGLAEAGSVVTIYDGETPVGSVLAGGDPLPGNPAAFFQSGVPVFVDGPHTLTATATNDAGTSPRSAPFTFLVDTIAPGAPSLSLDPSTDTGALGDNITTAQTVKIDGVAEKGASVTLFEGPRVLGTATADSDTGAFQITVASLSLGTHQFTAEATDVAGNPGPLSAAFTLAVEFDLGGPGGLDTIGGTPGADTLHGHFAGENSISGGGGDDSLLGGPGRDVVAGGGGNDWLWGWSGDNSLSGGAGNDAVDAGGDGNSILSGGEGNDYLYARGGNDILDGNAGSDTLTGGGGANRFVFDAPSDSSNTAPDLIVDFVHGVDKIDLSGMASGLTWAGSTPTANAVWFTISPTVTVIHIDAHSSYVGSDATINLYGTNLGLTASDFIL